MYSKDPLLSAALVVSGAAFCLLYLLTLVWPSGWAWHEGPPHASNYYLMIAGVYATLGVFLFCAARDPLAHASLIWFTVWSCVVHALIMAVESIVQPMHAGHLVGDVPALLLIAAVLAVLMRRARLRAGAAS